ncbi:MAG: hypothetical protein N838_15575 [Thiohalocapsa sp. PB-PSB1]|nr:MAG: hypothetical protein N838_15575 [Thiohalocapsa sp. PB-PSB1]
MTSLRFADLVRHLLKAVDNQRRLLHWNRTLARPASCGRVSNWHWRRHSALIHMRSEMVTERER